MARTIFQNANLLDGDHPARPGSQVVVEENRITSVAGGVAPESGDRVVDLAGRTLMPGLVTTHFHSSYDNITIMPQPLGLEAPPGYLTLCAARHINWALHSGFTSIVSAGAINDNIDVQLKLAMENGIIEGPRLVAGGLGLDTTGGTTDTEAWWWELGNHGAGRFGDGPDQFRAIVRDEIRRGSEIIKLFPSGGHGVSEEHEELSFDFDELKACVDTAHSRGVRVRAHSPWKASMHECLRAGVDIIDHGDRIDQQLIEIMAERGTYLVPSMYLIKFMLADTGNMANATEVQLAPIRNDFENMRQWLPKANDAGVKICLGDDFGIIVLPHGLGAYNKELEFYVKEVGMAPLDVIRWATKNGGELVAPDLGTIEAGKLADLLVVDGDPSVDISVLTDLDNIQAIVSDGKFVKDLLQELEARS